MDTAWSAMMKDATDFDVLRRLPTRDKFRLYVKHGRVLGGLAEAGERLCAHT